jgi:membrane peptidoglycan carboxypeptidase
MSYALENVHAAGGTADATRTGDGIPWIAKTGTAENGEHNWVMGSTTRVATVVWIGNVYGKVPVPSARFSGGNPGWMKQLIWRDVMRTANSIYGGTTFGTPDPNLVKGKSITVPAIQGLTMAQAKELIQSLGLTFTDGGEIDSELPLGTVAKSEPAIGEPASVGGEVKVFSSNQSLVAGPPSTVGMTVAEAERILRSAGWTPKRSPLPVPEAQCPVPGPVQTPAPNNPAPSPSTTACPGPVNPVLVENRIVSSQTPIGGFVKPTDPVVITFPG